MPSTNVSMFTALAGGIYMNNNNSENHCRILHKKNQYEVLGNIENAACIIKCERTKHPENRVQPFFRIYFFIPQSKGKSNRSGVKTCAAIQIHNISGPKNTCRRIRTRRAGGGHCGAAGGNSCDRVPGVEEGRKHRRERERDS